MNRKQIGNTAERRAESWLTAQGLTLLQRNARCRLGEIDLIMRDHDQIVFVEVRSRGRANFGGAAASVDWRKQQKLIRAARFMLSRNPGWNSLPCRFDVLAYEGDSESTPPVWYKDAFRP
jgi:putative endonuclease